ncbi:Ribonuclease VapC44 [Tepidimonas sediminis]|uniref:Ribonuclease VapC n=1 Tax=Tepidimonas sediminis TaxID=2588941 RepID=A0A554WR91_9BURK|nr:TA system VapC family ribonuclease toxin [Tepidimonas sediminis]TSE26085.1 Ribonuclease VapC44 [Tepidimonas sediminis]
MRSLLDVNVLIALLDAGHVDHAVARDWLQRHLDSGWASSPLTQNACVRIMSQPVYPAPLPASEVARRLARAVEHPTHRFLADDYSLLDDAAVVWGRVQGHRQITDLYLLGLAVRHGCRFVTFDARIDRHAVPGATARHLVVLTSAARSGSA